MTHEYVVRFPDEQGREQVRTCRAELPLRVDQILQAGPGWRWPTVTVTEIVKEPAGPGSAGDVRAKLTLEVTKAPRRRSPRSGPLRGREIR
jgi:hypothetical protein